MLKRRDLHKQGAAECYITRGNFKVGIPPCGGIVQMAEYRIAPSFIVSPEGLEDALAGFPVAVGVDGAAHVVARHGVVQQV